MQVEKAAVIGAGAMGSGIACVLSQLGIEILLKDVDQAQVDRGLANIKRMYDSRVKKSSISQEEADRHLALIKGTTDYKDFKDVDIVIEAAFEEISIKREIFKTLDEICPKHAILASNTSALSISEIAAATRRPEKVVGMHFFNPAQFMKLVEVIPGVKTSQETIKDALELCKQMRKTPVKVEECPGFLVNRVLFTYMNEALYVLQQGLAGIEEIDAKVMEFGLPMGPFALFDMTGIDVCAHVNSFLHEQYGPRFAPSPLLQKMVQAKALGQKTGQGFYLHEKDAPKGEAKKVNPLLPQLIKEANEELAKQGQALLNTPKAFKAERVILPMFNEALYCLQEKVVDAEDINTGMRSGCGFKFALLGLADKDGLEYTYKEILAYHKEQGERFRPSWLLIKLVAGQVQSLKELYQAPVAVG
jgi:3-hydroxyacyl-CoA dehydrogenase